MPFGGETIIKYAPFFLVRLSIFARMELRLYKEHIKKLTTVSIRSPVPAMFAQLVIAFSFVVHAIQTYCDE